MNFPKLEAAGSIFGTHFWWLTAERQVISESPRFPRLHPYGL